MEDLDRKRQTTERGEEYEERKKHKKEGSLIVHDVRVEDVEDVEDDEHIQHVEDDEDDEHIQHVEDDVIIADDDTEEDESQYYIHIDNDIDVVLNKIKDKEKLLKELNEELNELRKKGFGSYDSYKALFDEIDTSKKGEDGHGKITKAELTKFLQSLQSKYNAKITFDEIENLFLKRTNLSLKKTRNNSAETNQHVEDYLLHVRELIPELEEKSGIDLKQFLKFMYSNKHNITGTEILLLKKSIANNVFVKSECIKP